jgi:putative endonuclease
MPWFTYILECSDGSYYVGITNDVESRIFDHNAGKGALWTRMRRPVRLRFAQPFPSKSDDRKREIEIKGWRREKKEALFRSPVHVRASPE